MSNLLFKKKRNQKNRNKKLKIIGKVLKKRIAKLTKRMREAERQRDEAARYATLQCLRRYKNLLEERLN